MNFSTTSYLAGVGTVFAAVALGFAGGAMMTTSPRVEPNRLERVTAAAPATKPDATAPATTPDTSVKAGMPEIRSVVATKAPVEPVSTAKNEIKDEMPQSPPVPDRVISQTTVVTAQTPASASQQAVPPQPAPMTAKPVVARDDTETQADSARKARDDQLKRESASRSAERRAERRRERRRRDIDGAEDAVLRIQPDDGPQIMSPRYERSPRLGFFGDN